MSMMEGELRNAVVHQNETIFYKMVHLLAYAIGDIIARWKQYVTAAFAVTAKVILQVNEDKRNFMLLSDCNPNNRCVAELSLDRQN